ncbi:2'-5' RNA ligase family protein [Streptacidiphilus fuscans]|uniref:2'-5' RNA ligase family protein n=1 Tax=Streptacidiphilus fuscans TaxID=2789292 RepID=A0A931FIJ2_9ACTN|nr:2'-5' RNA ligase family protein [Streptacidiphilus fuscans]MBF9071839.1 hypothetical protein [Streptacidiphilus fuscans]
MDDFFQRVGTRATAPWPAGRRDLHIHILPTPSEAETLTAPYRGLAESPGLHTVPAEWIHVTVLHGEPMEQLTKEEVTGIGDRLTAALAAVEPFDLVLNPATPGTVALECAGHPGEPARRLWELAREAVRAETGDRWPLLPSAYYPHVSIAYAGAEAEQADRTALKIWLSDHVADPMTVRADALQLVAQWHDGAYIRWEQLRVIPIGPSDQQPGEC